MSEIQFTREDGVCMAGNGLGTWAKIILDSISPDGIRLVTMICNLHRFILAELNTHRALSKSSASSRAIPIQKQIDRVVENAALPLYWGANQKGMQAAQELEGETLLTAQAIWNMAKGQAALNAAKLEVCNLHKQLSNRLLEPFMWHTVIITGTEWDNFFHQRCSPMAQPEMKALADCMQMVYYKSEPKEIAYEDWHLPYIENEDWLALPSVIDRAVIVENITPENPNGNALEARAKAVPFMKGVSTARCARVSYLQHDGKRDMLKDWEMYCDKLLAGGHWTPFEHIATPVVPEEYLTQAKDVWLGNFRGWKQHRKEFGDENHRIFVPNLPGLEKEAEVILNAKLQLGGPRGKSLLALNASELPDNWEGN